MGWVSKVEAFLCPENDVFSSECERVNVDIFSIIQCSLWCYLACVHMHRSHLGTLTNASYLLYAFSAFSLETHTGSSLFRAFFFSPLSPFSFRLGMPDVRSKEVLSVEHCYRAAVWNAPSPNLILALRKIVCIPSRTDRPLFQESHCCPGH